MAANKLDSIGQLGQDTLSEYLTSLGIQAPTCEYKENKVLIFHTILLDFI